MASKLIPMTFLVTLAIACAPETTPDRTEVSAQVPRNTDPVVLFLGTSLTAGLGLTPDMDAVRELRKG